MHRGRHVVACRHRRHRRAEIAVERGGVVDAAVRRHRAGAARVEGVLIQVGVVHGGDAQEQGLATGR